MSRETTRFTPLTLPRLGKGEGESAQYEAARRRGHSTGYAEGMRLAAQEARAAEDAAQQRRAEQSRIQAEATSRALDALAMAKDTFDARARELTHLTEDRVTALAVELAEAILGAELSDPVQAALNAASRAAREAVSRADAVVILNPGDLATLDSLGELPEQVTFESDPTIAPGDSAVRLPDGEVDLRVSTAVARVRETLARELA